MAFAIVVTTIVAIMLPCYSEAAAPVCNRDWRMSDLSCIELKAESQSFGHPSQDKTTHGWLDRGPSCLAAFMAFDATGKVLPNEPGDDGMHQRCHTGVDYFTAEKVCSANGARLCRIDELSWATASTQLGCNKEFAGTSLISSTKCATGFYGSSVKGQSCLSATAVTSSVVCCGDVTPLPKARSEKACESLPLFKDVSSGSEQVCAASDVDGNGCNATAMSYNDAKSYCERLGARLCSYGEYMVGEARGTGCGFDAKDVWTDTRCGTCNGPVSYLTHAFKKPKVGEVSTCTQGTTLASVRCCADKSPRQALLSGTSCMSCNELGWSSGFGSDTVCADSEILGQGTGDGSCLSTDVPWAVAEDLCYDAGARLCSEAELLGGETVLTGCNKDTEFVWSRTSCAKGKFSAVIGNPLFGGATKKKCLDPTEDTSHVRCCADVDRNRSPQSCQDAKVDSQLYLNLNTWAKAEDGVCYSDGLPFDDEGTIQSTPTCQTGSLEEVKQICAFNNARLCHWTDLNRVPSSKYTYCTDRQPIPTLGACTLTDDTEGLFTWTPGRAYPRCLPSNGTFPAVCCTDDLSKEEAPVTSKRSCQDLGWVGSPDSKRLDVCAAATDPITGKCFTDAIQGEAMTYSQAEATCSKLGARLCTIYELRRGEATSTGCNVDATFAWSATECGRCGNEAYSAYRVHPAGEQCVDHYKTAAVRCCADASTAEAQLTGLSSRTCGELGWSPSRTEFDTFGHVCAASAVSSTDGEASCPTAATPFAVAEQYCASLGARLCSAEEVEAEETRGSGCGFDLKRIWTRSPCENGFYTMPGASYATTIKKECTASSDAAFVRCCADEIAISSSRSCTELRREPLFSNISSYPWGRSDEGVCADSELPFGLDGNKLPTDQLCQRVSSVSHATKLCALHGARLCTRSELTNVSLGSGCGFDAVKTVSGSPCQDSSGNIGQWTLVPTQPTEVACLTTAYVAPDDDQLAVRCCADEEVQGQEVSLKSCDDLGWPTNFTTGASQAEEVCTQGAATGGAMIYKDAVAHCHALGARLCQLDEFYNVVTLKGAFWTDVDCTRGGVRSRLAFYGGSQTTSCDPEGWPVGVTCCADAVSLSADLTGPSCKSCGELGWVSKVDVGNDIDVCADSEVVPGSVDGEGQCQDSPVPFITALKICSEIGARLCSLDEIQNGETARTGCNLDSHRVWTRTECAQGQYISTAGSPAHMDTIKPQCTAPSVDAYVRCCADEVHLPAFYTCDELRKADESLSEDIKGWTDASDEADQVCAASELAYNALGEQVDPSEACQHASVFHAEQICASNGARLCSVLELYQHSALSGCNFDSANKVSGSPCFTSSGEAGFYIVPSFFDNTSKPFCVGESSTAVYAVRCCADEAVRFRIRTRKTCQQLQASNGFLPSNSKRINSCGGSKVATSPDGTPTCVSKPVSFAEAAKTCSALGARLCSFSELVIGVSSSTGCLHNGRPIWSSSPCDRCGQAQQLVYSMQGENTQGYGDRSCVSVNHGEAYVRCCADPEIQNYEEPDNPSCKSCLQLTTFTESQSVEDVCFNSRTDGVCSPQMDFAAAMGFCEDQGARLCSSKELTAIMTADTDNCTGKMVKAWSRSACGQNSVTTVKPDGTTACIAVDSSPLDVVCCGDDQQPLTSDKSCLELRVTKTDGSTSDQNSVNGWTVPTINSTTCSAAELAYDATGRSSSLCHKDKTYRAAELLCFSNGARLCSVKELLRYKTQATSCSFAGATFISGSSCGEHQAYQVDTAGNSACVSTEDATFAVRCCADEQGTSHPFSKQSCKELGYPDPRYGDGTVCGASTVADNSTCPKAMSFSAAKRLCTSQGARLCTLSEYVGGADQDTGCAFNAKYVWTDTSCSSCQGPAQVTHNLGLDVYNCSSTFDSAFVRCCADAVSDQVTLSGPSCKTCSELNWDPTQGTGDQKSSICAESEILPGDACLYETVDFYTASRICEDAGARLCDVSEIHDGETAGSGCFHDARQVWTRSSCGNDRFFSHIGNLNNLQPNATMRQCRSVLEKAVVRCCADETAPPSDLSCALLRLQAQGYTHPPNGLDLSGGWSNQRNDNDPVCAASLLALNADGDVVPPEQRCQRASHDQALSTCLANSARLCTRFELKNEAPNTGCAFNGEYVHSATSCDGGFWGVKVGAADACLPASQDAAVRCCADEIVPSLSTSKLSCDILGWELSHDGRVDICGSSNVGANSTVVARDVSYQEAASTCRAAGARLCRASELVLGAAESTGGMHDFNPTWSSTPCDTCGKSAFLTVQVKGAGFPLPACLAREQTARVRCCADVDDDSTLLVDESPMTCDQLGWLNGAVASHTCSAGRVAGAASSTANSSCIAASVAFRQAEQLCFDYGARLCDASELGDRQIVTNECLTEQAAGLWTRTSCPGGFQVLPWDATQASQCSKPDQKADVMCCADDDTVSSELSCSSFPQLKDYSSTANAWQVKDNVCFSRVPARNAAGQLKTAPNNMAIGDALAACSASFARSCSSAELSAFASQADQTFATSSRCTTDKGSPGQITFNPNTQTLACMEMSSQVALACCADALGTNTSSTPLSLTTCEASDMPAIIPGHASCSNAKTDCANRTRPASYSVAQQYCQAQNMRLCTLSELSVVAAMDDAAACTSGYFWTSTDCSRAGQAAAVAQRVPYQQNIAPSTCNGQRWGSAHVVCCADSTQVQLWQELPPASDKPTGSPSGTKGHDSKGPPIAIIVVVISILAVIVLFVLVRRKRRSGAVTISSLQDNNFEDTDLTGEEDEQMLDLDDHDEAPLVSTVSPTVQSRGPRLSISADDTQPDRREAHASLSIDDDEDDDDLLDM
eukprot:m.261284 g.261284  ORF g.261284 m.261284 type:complete len:2833 (+) comp17596_c0_seq5:884-9382(+)